MPACKGGPEFCTWLKFITEKLCKNLWYSVLGKKVTKQRDGLSARRAFEDNHTRYNSTETVSGSWAAPQHYRHFLPPNHITDSQRPFMSLWPLCRAGSFNAASARSDFLRAAELPRLPLVCQVIDFTVSKGCSFRKGEQPQICL